MTAYGTDLAFIHEAGFAALADAAARHVRSMVAPPGLVVDLGCGGGTLLAALVDEGFQGLGVDTSAAMVALARRRVPAATWTVGSAYEVPIPQARVVTAVGEVLNYVQAPDTHLKDVSTLIHRVGRALQPGGVFLFDAATTERPAGRTSNAREHRTWRVKATAKTHGHRLTRTIDAWRTVDGETRHTHEVHELRLLDPDWVIGQLEDAGFTARRLAGYDDHAFQVGWDGFLARRPEPA
jgi:SAM-dependent methyltransferase